jgi:hypothetical protein
VKAGEFDGVLLVGFDVIAGLGGNERRRDDRAGHFHFVEQPGNPHAAPACLVANGDPAKRDVAVFGDAPDQAVEGDLAGGDFAVAADLALGVGIGNGDGGFFFMDVKADVECGCRV